MIIRWLRGLIGTPVNGGARVKILGLAVSAAVPLVILASVVIAESYDGAERTAIQTASLMHGFALAQFAATRAATVAALTDVEAMLPTAPGPCNALLAGVVEHNPFFAGLNVRNLDGTSLCRAGIEAAGNTRRDYGAMPLSSAGPNEPPHAGLRLADGRTIEATLPWLWLNAALPAPQDAYAGTWLLDPGGTIVAQRGLIANHLPTPKTIRTLLGRGDTNFLARAPGGTPFAYLGTPMKDGWRLITLYDATREYHAVVWTVALRLLGIAGLLLLALASVVAGAGLSFGEPLRRLAAAVTRWQAGQAFEPGPLGTAPWEVRELARSFTVATAALRQGELALKQSQERQDLLVLEIHHRVKNNLQIIASLLNLQASRIRVPEAKAEFQSARDRVRALATLHRHLYSDGELHTINMRSFLVELCGQLFQAIGEREGDRIQLTIEAPELRLSSDEAVPMSLIVTEAVTNAIKYAFPNNRRGQITVRLTQSDGALLMVVEDDGVGIPIGTTETESGRRDGLGLQLIRGFSRQLGAVLEIEESHGTRYSIRLPSRPRDADAPLEALDAA